MTYRRLSIMLALLACIAVNEAIGGDFGPSDRAVLTGYARDTWRSFDALALPSGLPADSLSKTPEGWTAAFYTSPSDIAAYLWSILAAEDLKIIGREEANDRLGRTLGALAKLDRSHGFFLNWYDPRDGSGLKTWPGGSPVRPFLSTVDNAWLAVALMMIRNARPAFRSLADEILDPMNFGFFYDAYDPTNPGQHPGLLRGGFYADDNTFASYHYGMLNTEARIASYVGIARGHLPPDHYFRLSRSRPPGSETRPTTSLGETRSYLNVPVQEGYNSYRGLRVVPSWDGSMFEALMVTLFIPESDWAPQGWGVNHALYVRASIENAKEDGRLAAWGASPSSIPGGGYRVYGVAPLSVDGRGIDSAKESVMTPHASFLALPFAPKEAMSNVEVLASRFHAYGPHGFLDAVDVTSGKVASCELALDQGMIMASVANALGDGMLQRAFCEGKVAEIIRPLIAPEKFGAGVEPRPGHGRLAPKADGFRSVAQGRADRDLPGQTLLTSGASRPAVRRLVTRSFGEFALSN